MKDKLESGNYITAYTLNALAFLCEELNDEEEAKKYRSLHEAITKNKSELDD